MENTTFFDMDDNVPQQAQMIADITTTTPFTVSYSPPRPTSASPSRSNRARAPAPAPAPAPVAAPEIIVASTSKPSTSFAHQGIHRWLAAHRPYLPHDQASSLSLAVPTTTSSATTSTRSGRLLPVQNSTPRSAFSDSEDDESEEDEEEDSEEDEEDEEEPEYFGQPSTSFVPSSSRIENDNSSSDDNSSEDEAEEEMLYLRPRRSHGSRAASAQQQRATETLIIPTEPVPQLPRQHVRRRTPPMPLSLSAQRPALPIVDLSQACGTSSFDQPELAVLATTTTSTNQRHRHLSIPPPLQTGISLPKSHWSDDEDDEEEEEEEVEEEEEEEEEEIMDAEEALWLVVDDDLPALDADEDANDAPSTSTRSLPIPISLPLDHYTRTLTVDEQQLPLEVCVQKTLTPHAIVAVHQQQQREKEEEEGGQSPPGRYRASRLIFQRGQSFYKPWLEEYIHQPYHRHS